MTIRQRRYSKEALAQRGQELYESGIQQQVEAGNKGKIVAIDIEMRSTSKQVLLSLPMRRWKLLEDSMNESRMHNPGFLELAIVPFIVLGRVASKTRYDARLGQYKL
jgi:hypothetical protein